MYRLISLLGVFLAVLFVGVKVIEAVDCYECAPEASNQFCKNRRSYSFGSCPGGYCWNFRALFILRKGVSEIFGSSCIQLEKIKTHSILANLRNRCSTSIKEYVKFHRALSPPRQVNGTAAPESSLGLPRIQNLMKSVVMCGCDTEDRCNRAPKLSNTLGLFIITFVYFINSLLNAG